MADRRDRIGPPLRKREDIPLDEVTGALLPPDKKKRQEDTHDALVVTASIVHFNDLKLSSVGFQIPDNLPKETWTLLGERLAQAGNMLQWCLGDWLAYGEDREWGETYKRIANEFNLEIDTLYRYAAVARRVRIGIRNPELTMAHHRLVAYLKEEDHQQYFLQQAAHNEWTVAQLRDAINNLRPEKTLSLWSVMRRWDKKHEKVADEYLELAHKIGSAERAIMVDRLRNLLAEIESLG